MGINKSREKPKARILVVDDHPLMREGLRQIIGLESDLECCGEAHSGQGALDAMSLLRPDLVLLDLRLGNEDGLELIKVFAGRFPEARILVISELDERLYAERALRAGACGFVRKEQPPADVLCAIRAVLAGQIYADSKLAAMALLGLLGNPLRKQIHPAPGLDRLTDRELQIFHLLGAGQGVRKIAGELKLSVKTVETHRENIKHKMGFATAAELARHAVEWVQMRDKSAAPQGTIGLAP